MLSCHRRSWHDEDEQDGNDHSSIGKELEIDGLNLDDISLDNDKGVTFAGRILALWKHANPKCYMTTPELDICCPHTLLL